MFSLVLLIRPTEVGVVRSDPGVTHHDKPPTTKLIEVFYLVAHNENVYKLLYCMYKIKQIYIIFQDLEDSIIRHTERGLFIL